MRGFCVGVMALNDILKFVSTLGTRMKMYVMEAVSTDVALCRYLNITRCDDECMCAFLEPTVPLCRSEESTRLNDESVSESRGEATRQNRRWERGTRKV